MLIGNVLDEARRQWPDKTAVVADRRRHTFSDIDDAANRLASALAAAGVRRGDPVVIHLENGVAFIVAMFAVFKASAVFVPVGAHARSDRLVFVLNDCRAVALITSTKTCAGLAATPDATPSLRVVVVTDEHHGDLQALDIDAGPRTVLAYRDIVRNDTGSASPPSQQNIDIDLAALIYTSGSTGRPKGVMLTHMNMSAVITSIVAYLKNTVDDVILNALPMSHGYGLYQALTAFSVGATLVVERSFAFPHAILTAIEREGVTGFPLVPAVASTLVRMNLASYDLSRLRYMSSAAAPLPRDHIARLRAALPNVQLFYMYGLTECQRVSYLPPAEIDTRPGSVGRGMPNLEAYVVDAQGRRVGPDVVGELVVRGAHVMKGYWGRPGETEQRLRPGPVPNEVVLHTGDLFRMDADGYLYFVSRSDDMINSGGEKISPREIEDVVYELEQVDEVAVLATPDDRLGEAVKAIVAVRTGAQLTADDVRRHCARRLEPFKVPAHVDFISAIPHLASGKVDRRALRAAGVDE